MVILEQQVALPLEHRLYGPANIRESRGKQHLHPHLALLHVDGRLDGFAERSDLEVERVACPAGWTCARPGMCSSSRRILLAIRRRASSLPSLWGRSTSMGCDIDPMSAGVQRFSSAPPDYESSDALTPAVPRRAGRAPSARSGAVRPPPGIRSPTTSPRARTSRDIAPGISRCRRGRQVKAFNDYLATYQAAGSCRPGSCFGPRPRGRNAAASRSKSRRPLNGRTSSRPCATSTITWCRRSGRSKPSPPIATRS